MSEYFSLVNRFGRVKRLGLLRQFLLSLDHQVRIGVGGAGPWLSSADGNQVVAGGDETIARFIHVAKVARTEGEFHVFLLTRFQVDAGDPAQRTQRCAR
jgi:hypothetical protein